ncbi:MAG TPA: DUF4129 domain-containing protein [Chloroflexota bacterium]|nr:DUF4129 domain-containing protein [Chloroflexota bacterium]
MGEDFALSRLREILARSEFQVDQSRPWWEQLFGPVLDLIGYLVARFFQIVADTTSGQEGSYGIGVLGICLALIAAVVVYLVRSIRLSVRRESSVRSASLAERRERSERLWQTAQQLAAAGQLAEAVRVVYLSALYALDERALLHVESSLTNREHARQLSRLHPDVGRTFNAVVDRYDRVRYGRIPITDAMFSELSGLVALARTASLQSAST